MLDKYRISLGSIKTGLNVDDLGARLRISFKKRLETDQILPSGLLHNAVMSIENKTRTTQVAYLGTTHNQ